MYFYSLFFTGQQPPPVQRAPSPGQVRGLSSPQTGATFYPPPSYLSSQSQNSGFSSSAPLSRGQVPMGPHFSYNQLPHYPPQHQTQAMQMSQTSMMPQSSMMQQTPMYPTMMGPGPESTIRTNPNLQRMMMQQQVNTNKIIIL